jgi:hypothetical protein
MVIIPLVIRAFTIAATASLEPNEELSFRNFAASLSARAIAFTKLRQEVPTYVIAFPRMSSISPQGSLTAGE